MGWLDWLIGAAITAVAAWLVVETVSYFINKQNLRQLMLEKKAEKHLDNAAISMIRNNTGREVSFDFLDSMNRNLGSGKITSNAGISSDIRQGDVIKL